MNYDVMYDVHKYIAILKRYKIKIKFKLLEWKWKKKSSLEVKKCILNSEFCPLKTSTFSLNEICVISIESDISAVFTLNIVGRCFNIDST